MDKTTRDLITRLFIADCDSGSDFYDRSEACAAVAKLRDHLEATGQWAWDKDADPILKDEPAPVDDEAEDEPSEDDCDCNERSWYGDWHDSACPLAGKPRKEEN